MTHDAEAAALLRNAALVLEHTGHTRLDFVDKQTGTLCIDGALRVAASHGYYRDKLGRYGYLECFPADATSCSLAYATAIQALIQLLPETCTVHTSQDKCGYGNLDLSLSDTPARVHHFNDFVCDGGDEAQLVLVQAAEKIEANL
jgi:hypothetical protein